MKNTSTKHKIKVGKTTGTKQQSKRGGVGRCDGECDNEKHKKPKYICPSCGSVFCERCRLEQYVCLFCEPPDLELIPNLNSPIIKKAKTSK